MDALWCWYIISASIWDVSWLTEKLFEFGLGYDLVMKLCKDISGKNYVYCDNLFTSVQLLKDLLACKTYCNMTIWVNKKYLPEGIHKPGRMIHGAYKSCHNASSNLVATVWQDSRIVRLVNTNLNPTNVVHTDWRFGHNVIQVNLPQKIQLYNRCTNAVGHHDQMCIKYNVGYFSVKAWKYIFWYFVNTSIVNAYILYCKASTRQTKRSLLLSTFHLRLQWDWLLDFHWEKGRQKPHCTLGLWQLQMK